MLTKWRLCFTYALLIHVLIKNISTALLLFFKIIKNYLCFLLIILCRRTVTQCPLLCTYITRQLLTVN